LITPRDSDGEGKSQKHLADQLFGGNNYLENGQSLTLDPISLGLLAQSQHMSNEAPF
jgi:hypothetical protein